MRLILGSSSPRRRELIAALGLPFEVRPAPIDEEAIENAHQGPPEALALAVARAKSAASHPSDGEVIVAADTVVTLNGESLGKPRDLSHALGMLKALAGTSHEVTTAVVIATALGRAEGSTTTRVSMKAASEAQLKAYVDTGEPLDKAGGYGIQSLGADLIHSVDGCYLTVVGFPLCLVCDLLTRTDALELDVDPAHFCRLNSPDHVPFGVSPHPALSRVSVGLR